MIIFHYQQIRRFMMNNLTEIKAKLDNYYQKYKNNNSSLNSGEAKLVTKLIVDIIFSKDGSLRDAAIELARFPANVTDSFFESLTKNKSISSETVNDILKELLATDTDAKLSQYYVSKYVFAITSIIKYYKDDALTLPSLSRLVAFIARFAVKSDKNKKKFCDLVKNTEGYIFKLDYSNSSETLLLNIWKVTNNNPDLLETYKPYIAEWSKKYGFINDNSISADKAAKSNDRKEMPFFSSGKKVVSAEDKTTNESDEKTNTTAVISAAISETETEDEKLCNVLRKDISKEKDAIIAALTELIAPIGKAVDSIQREVEKNREIEIENVSLKAEAENLKQQLSEQKLKNDNLKKQIEVVESKNSELDSKLNDAYAINSRESSLEAEKIRSELKKAFKFLYEDWLEYEFSDVNEENYESLQAIIKKIFRSLERNGIDFKEE